jgi:hypothetical protein
MFADKKFYEINREERHLTTESFYDCAGLATQSRT